MVVRSGRLAAELAPHYIRVSAILSGAVDETGLFSGRVDEALRERVRRSISLKRFVGREQVPSPVVFLASDESGKFTGTDNLIDGGASIQPAFAQTDNFGVTT